MLSSSGRRVVGFALLAGSLALTAGCKTGGTWGMPAWPKWGWGGAASPSATALNITKPSTQAPAPVTSPPGQPTRGLAGNSAYPSGVAAAGSARAGGHISDNSASIGPASGVYPATAQADAVPGRGGNTWQPGAEGGGQVAPAAGYQVGPYSMQANAASPASGYAAGRSSAGALPAASGATGPYAPAEGGPAGGYGGTEGYRTATQSTGSNIGGNPWSGDGANPVEESGTGSIYNGNNTGGDANLYGPGGGATEGAAAEGSSGTYNPAANQPASTTTAPAHGYGPPNTVAPGSASAPRHPSTTPPAASGIAGAGTTAPSTLPASLTASGGFRPGSTASPGSRFGAENAGYDQPQTAVAPGNEPAYGNTYRR